METIMIYLLKVNVILSLFFMTYILLLRKEHSFHAKRIFFLSIIILSFSLPLIPSIGNFVSPNTVASTIRRNKAEIFLSPYKNPNQLKVGVGQSLAVDIRLEDKSTPSILLVSEVLSTLYIFISILSLSFVLIGISKLLRLIGTAKQEKINGIVYCALERPIAPFSFFNYLVINKLTYSDKQLNDIITHEKVHIRQWHSIDVLLIELVHCILWINPFLFFLKKALKLNLEFIADEKVISSGVNVVNYQLTILQNSLKSNFHLANLFNSPKIKQRIEMMDTANDSNTKIYKYALVLPCLLLCNILFGSMTVRESYQPISSGSASTGITNKGTVNEKLKPFEGYYKFQFEKGKDVYIKISQRDKQLVLHELFAGNEVKFDQVAETEFYNKKQDFNLTFKKATDGNITHLLAFKYDLWTRVEMPKKTYQPISLDEAQINNIDGLYQSENTSNGVVKITVGNNKLVLAPLWKDNNFVMNTSANHFYPLSDCKFYNKEVDIDIETGFKFIKNEAGKIIMSVHPDGTIFHKIDNYTPAKEISIPNKNLKRVEGKYASKFNDGEEFIQITSKGNSLVIKELWTNGNTKVYVPESNSKFFTKDEPSTIEFNEETNGSISGAAIAYPMSKKIWKKLE